MRDRDRYQNHTYTESRDRGRAEHAAQDLADEDYPPERELSGEVCPVCRDAVEYCPIARGE